MVLMTCSSRGLKFFSKLFLLASVVCSTAVSAFAEPPPISSCNVVTSTFSSTDVPRAIADNTTIDSVLEVTGGRRSCSTLTSY